jgi:uncharacterized protein YndB with AHSA1/START domain
MRMILIALGALVLLLILAVAGLFAWGTQLPESHTASASEVVPAPEADVFRRIVDAGKYTAWRKDVKTVEVLDESRWIEDGGNGRIPFKVMESSPPSRLVVRIDTEDLPFDGSWTYALSPVRGGTRVEITENGRVKNAMFRAMGRLFFPHDKTMKAVLADLRRSFE